MVKLRIGIDKRVEEKKKNGRKGTIVGNAIGAKKWTVQFDDTNGSEEKTSAQLRVCTQENGVQQTPPRKALPTIQKAPPMTGLDDESSVSSTPKSKRKSVFNRILSSVNRLTTPLLQTPRSSRSDSSIHSFCFSPSDKTATRPRTLFQENTNRVYVPEQHEYNVDEEDDEEDDHCGMRDLANTEDGGIRMEFFAEPERGNKYQKAKEEMEAAKKELIETEHTFDVTVNTKMGYDMFSRVKGRKKNDEINGLHGTIVKVIDDNLFTIEWDRGGMQDVRKSHLVLVYEKQKIYSWKTVADHVADTPPSKYQTHGLVDFHFSSFSNLDRESDNYAYPFAKLVETLWPGNWRDQMGKVNASIEIFNREKKPNRVIKELTDDEWWTFWGIVIIAAKVGNGGVTHLYNTKVPVIAQLPNVNLADIMPKYRFELLLKFIHDGFSGESPEDPWNAVLGLVNGFNDNRAQNVAASYTKVHDESMSSYRPTTTALGGLPFLSYILRKPKPLGTEFKTCACTETGVMLHLEIQQGKIPMRSLPYSRKYGGTAGCTLRLIEATQYCGSNEPERQNARKNKKRESYYGDSWFTSRRLCEGLKDLFCHEWFGALKTNHSGTPKEEIEKIMKDWPSGSYLVVECEELQLFMVGYKYNYRKNVCFFLGTYDSGSTMPGKPYVTKWPDDFGNVKSRDVVRPDCIGKYFNTSNTIDVHNQLRQNELALEQHWRTNNPWFRIITTVIGMTVVDAFLLAKYSAPSGANFAKMAVQDFAMHIVKDMWTRKISSEPRSEILVSNVTVGAQAQAQGAAQGATQSNRDGPLSLENAVVMHEFRATVRRYKAGSNELVRRVCSIQANGCQYVSDKKKIKWECIHPTCYNSLGRNGRHDYAGVFVCENSVCRMKHWKDVVALSSACLLR